MSREKERERERERLSWGDLAELRNCQPHSNDHQRPTCARIHDHATMIHATIHEHAHRCTNWVCRKDVTCLASSNRSEDADGTLRSAHTQPRLATKTPLTPRNIGACNRLLAGRQHVRVASPVAVPVSVAETPETPTGRTSACRRVRCCTRDRTLGKDGPAQCPGQSRITSHPTPLPASASVATLCSSTSTWKPLNARNLGGS